MRCGARLFFSASLALTPPGRTTITPKVAFRFTAYHQLMSLAPRKTFLASLAAGMGAGAVEALVVCPSEIVKIRQQDRSAVPRTQWATFKLLLQEGGVAALYRGALVTTIRQSVQQGCKFAIFEQIRSALGPDSGVPSAVVDLAGGAVANTVGAVINTPVDVVKSRMQRQVGQEVSVSPRFFFFFFFFARIAPLALFVRIERISQLARFLFYPLLLDIVLLVRDSSHMCFSASTTACGKALC